MVLPMRNISRGIVMRTAPPQAGEDWFRIENKGDDITHVYIYDEIGYWGTRASDFVKELAAVDTKQIHLHINSPGGEVFDGVAIHNAIAQHSAETTVFIDALAASAASFIAMAGDKVVMAKNATMMIHDALGLAYGNQADMKEMGDLLGRISDTISGMYADKAGGTPKDWRKMMKAETWYNAQEALDASLVDEVLAKENKDAEEATNKWDLSVFNYSGRKNAPSPLMQRMLIGNQTEASMRTDESNTQSTGTGTAPDEGEAAQTTGNPEEEGSGAQTQQTGTEQAPTQPAPAPNANPTPPSNQTGVLINGQRTTDWAAIQAALDAGNQFRKETVESARRDFVTNLARSNKISATQIESLQNFALTLTDEQFVSWSASYESAPANSLFSNHGETPADNSRPGEGTKDSVADRITVLEAIVADHRRTGMSDETLKTKASYIELQELKAKSSQSQ